VWPIVYGATQWVQTKMNPAPADPMQARMFAFMPIIFTFMFAAFPAGLVIYYTWNNILSVAQQYVIMRREGVKVHLFENLKFSKATTANDG
jgi:YidC/Oxa1 family membrane protein insertase